MQSQIRPGMYCGARLMREHVAAFLYVIIITVMTLLYIDYENIELLKHPISAFSATHSQFDDNE